MWENFDKVMQLSFLGIEMWQYITSLGAIFTGFALKRIVTQILDRIAKAAEKTRTRLDDIFIGSISKPAGWMILIGAIYISIIIMPLPMEPVNIRELISALAQACTLIFASWFLLRLTDNLAEEFARQAQETDSKVDDQLVPLIRKTMKVFIVVIAVVMVLQALGYSVGGLIAGFGLGGAAFALASKDTVANLFGSIVVFVDKPFRVGDWIEVGSIEGTVEEVGIRTTKVRTFANSLITMPNSTFTTSHINNWSRMKKRRIKTTIGLTYDTPPDKMEQAVEAIRKILREDKRIHQEFFLVNFHNMGAYSLDIFIYTFTITIGWADHLQIKQEVFLKIMLAFQELGVQFAFPTQTLHVQELPGGVPEHMEKDLPS